MKYSPIICMLITLIMAIVFSIRLAFGAVDMAAIATIESNNNNLAESFLGAKYGRGKYQISEICLKDFLQYHKDKKYEPVDLYLPSVNEEIANWYMNIRIPQLLKHYGIFPVTDQNIICSYNAGVKNLSKGYPYYKKYLIAANKRQPKEYHETW